MISPIRSLCFNDDHQTFTIVLPSQYRIFRCEPFGMVFSRDCEDLSLGNVATYSSYRFIALTGSTSPPIFNSKCVRIFDHQKGEITFEHSFEDHILTMKLGDGIVVVNMHCKIQIWSTSAKMQLSSIDIGPNVHCPICMSPDSNSIICGGADNKKIYFCTNTKTDNMSKKGLKVDTNTISLVEFSSNGQYFATSAFNGNPICVWDAKMLSCITFLEKENEGDIVQTVDFSPSGEYLASCTKEGKVCVYDIIKTRGNLKGGQPICSVDLPSVIMPRIIWMNEEIIGVISLDGDYYKIEFNGSSLEVETTPFLKRTTTFPITK